jgi:hypothetical protein
MTSEVVGKAPFRPRRLLVLSFKLLQLVLPNTLHPAHSSLLCARILINLATQLTTTVILRDISPPETLLRLYKQHYGRHNRREG